MRRAETRRMIARQASAAKTSLGWTSRGTRARTSRAEISPEGLIPTKAATAAVTKRAVRTNKPDVNFEWCCPHPRPTAEILAKDFHSWALLYLECADLSALFGSTKAALPTCRD